MDIQEFRGQYPQYDDVSDTDLARSLHQKFYSDVPFNDFETAFVGSTKPSDYAKSLASGALSGAGMIAQGGGELLARGINAVAPEAEARSINPFQGAIDWLETSKSPAAKAKEAGSQISGNLFDWDTWNAGTNPTMAGIALQGLNAIGQFFPNLAVGIATAGASVPAQLTIGAVTGGLQALGGGAEQERDTINNMSEEDLRTSSKLYNTFLKTMPPAQARAATADAAALGGGLGNAALSAPENAFETFLIGALTKGKMPGPVAKVLGGGGLASKVVRGAAGGAALGGTEESVEQMGQNLGSNLAIGGNRPLTADTLQQFVMGAIAEGAAGAGGGAYSHVTQPKAVVGTQIPAETMAAGINAQRQVSQGLQAIDAAPDVDTAIAAADSIVSAPVDVSRTMAFARAEAQAGQQKATEVEAAYQQREDRIAQLNRMIQMELERDAARTEAGRQDELARREAVQQADLTDQTRGTIAQAATEAPQTAMSLALARAAGAQPPGYVSQDELLRRMEEWNRRQNAVREQSTGTLDVRNPPANGEGVGVENRPVQPAAVQEQPAPAQLAGEPNAVDAEIARRMTASIPQNATPQAPPQPFGTPSKEALLGQPLPMVPTGTPEGLADLKKRTAQIDAYKRRNAVDQHRDSLFSAIAKLGGLNKQEVVSSWGIDKADLEQKVHVPQEKLTPEQIAAGQKPRAAHTRTASLTPIFGKPVLRSHGGMSIDGMAELLQQYGYLDQRDLREFEAKFDQELRGKPVLTIQGHEQAAQQTAAQAEEDQKAESLGLTHTELVVDGYEALNEQEKEQAQSIIDALVQHAQGKPYEALVDAILERAAIQAGDRPYKEYAQAVITQIREVIANAENPNNQPAQVERGAGRESREEAHQATGTEGGPRAAVDVSTSKIIGVKPDIAQNNGQPALALTSQTPEELRAAASPQALVQREAVERKAIADREREHFTLTPQTPEHVAAPSQQEGLFTPTGNASTAAKTPATPSAFEEFDKATKAYRAREIGDTEFLAAKKKYDATLREFDKSRGELARPYKDTPRAELNRLYHETDDDAQLHAVEDEINLRAEEKAKAREDRLAKGREEKAKPKAPFVLPESLKIKPKPIDTLEQNKSGYNELPRLSVLHNLSAENLQFADKMGGLAVPSLGVVPDGLGISGMGEITLIGRKDLANPAEVPIHDADVYSQTFPRPEYNKVPTAVAQRVLDKIKPFDDKFDDYNARQSTWDDAVNSPDPQKIISTWMHGRAAKALFLHEHGVDVAPVMTLKQVVFPWVKYLDWAKFRELIPFNDERPMDVRERSTFEVKPIISEAVDKYLAQSSDGKKLDELMGHKEAREAVASKWGVKGNWINNDEAMPYSFESRIAESHSDLGKFEVDRRKTEDRLDKALKGREVEFKKWVDDTVLGMFSQPFIRMDGRKYTYSLDNIVDYMTGPVRAREKTLTYGEGKARAAAAKRFDDLEQMRRAAGNIADESTISAARDEAKKLIEAYRTDVGKYYGERSGSAEFGRVWDGLDASMKAMARWARGAKTEANMRRALASEGFRTNDMHESTFEDAVQAGMAWLKAPVPYFEAKPQRAVSLNEFAGAVIPKKSPGYVRDILDKHGIPYKEYATGGADQKAAQQLATNAFRKTLAKQGEGVLFQQKSEYNPDQADHIYDNAQTRPGTTGEQRQLGIAAIKALFGGDRRAGSTILGSALWRDFQEHKGVELVGQRAESAKDLATLAQVLRDPRFETFRIFFTAGDKIVGHTGMTSRLPGQVAVFVPNRGEDINEAMERRFEEFQKMKDAFGADGYWILHNHPSGSSHPSSNDETITNLFAESMVGFKGHVVIDHDEFSTINAEGKSKTHDIKSGARSEPEVAHELLGRRISSPGQFSDLGKQIQAKSGYDVMISTDHQGKVGGIAEVPTQLLLQGGRSIIRARRFARGTGGDRVFVVSQNPSRLERLVASGAVTDATDYAGHRSLQTLGIGMASGERTTGYKAKVLPAEQKKSEYDQTKTEAFKRWFGDSKVVDAEGKPLVVYHGTKADISEFQPSTGGEYGGGIYFSPDEGEAWAAAARSRGTEGQNIVPAYLSMQRPYYAKTRDEVRAMGPTKIQAAGYDGIIATGPTGDTQYIVYRPDQIKSDIGNRGTFNPESKSIIEQPRSPYIGGSNTTGDARDSYVRDASDWVRNLLHSDARVGWWAKSVGTQQHKALTLPAFKPVYDEGQAFLSDVSKYANGSADLAQDLLPRIEGFRDFLKKNAKPSDIAAAHDALMAGTLFGGGSPLEGRVWTDAELKKGRATMGGTSLPAFKPQTDAQIKLYREALAAAGKSLDELGKSLIHKVVSVHGIGFDREMSLEDVVATVNEQIKSEVDNRKLDLAALHDRAVEASKDDRQALLREIDRVQAEIDELEAAKKQVADISEKTIALQRHGYFPAMRFGKYAVHVVDAEGKQLYFSLFESQTKANIAAAELKKQYPDANIYRAIMSQEQHRLFQGLSLDALETFADYITGADGKPLSKDPIVQGFLKAAVADRSVLKRHIHRKGVAGFSEDMPRVLANFTTAAARHTAMSYHGAEMARLANDIKAGDVKDEAIKLVRYLQDPMEEAQGIRAFLFAQYLGGSIANGLVNMTQPFMMTFPFMTQHTSVSDSAIQIMKAAHASAHPEKLTGAEGEAYKRAHREGVVSPQEIHQLRAQTGGLPLAKNLALRKLSYLWGSIYALTEQFNRTTTFLAAYRIAEKKGIANPYAFAKDAVEQTQGVYNKGNRPNIGRGPVGATVMTFKQFSIFYLELAHRLYKHDKKAFALMALMLLAAGGIEGLPFAEDIEDMVDTMGQWLGYATNSKKKVRQWAMSILGPDMSQIALRGVSGLPWMPVDVSARMGMSNLIPGTALLKQSEKNKARDVIELVGPVGQLIPTEDTMLGRALERLAKGDVEGAIKAGAPRAVQAVVKGAEQLATGKATDIRGKKITTVTPGEAVLQMAGLNPSGVARESQRTGIVQQDIDLHNRMEDEIAEQWARGVVDKEPDQVKKAKQKLADWNADNPELRIAINSRQIMQRTKALRTSREERFVKGAPKEIRGAVREALR